MEVLLPTLLEIYEKTDRPTKGQTGHTESYTSKNFMKSIKIMGIIFRPSVKQTADHKEVDISMNFTDLELVRVRRGLGDLPLLKTAFWLCVSSFSNFVIILLWTKIYFCVTRYSNVVIDHQYCF